jgi:antibiotic biosynthesis monooxygenase (ABM) superfamily enzyme
MATIQVNTGAVTQINVFTVAPENQQALIDLLQEAANFASQVPGWISASIHRSLDGTRVVNYAQSKDLDSAQRVIEALRAAGWLDRNKALGEAHPGLYEVVFTTQI